MSEFANIVIIGSGACGAAAAWRLSQQPGYKIICLEQGVHPNPATYPSNQTNWEIIKQKSANVDPNIRQNCADYPVDNSESPINIANFNGVGGSTILYSAHFPRFHPSDFKTKTLDNVGDDWPISYYDLKTYFTENERMMRVCGLVGDPANPEYETLLPPIPLGKGGQKIAEGFNKLNWHWWPSYGAINTRQTNGQLACINLGPCNTGCAQGAKSSVDQTYWPLAIKQGVELRTNCTAYHIETDKSDHVSGVHYYSADGESHFIQADVIVLASSGLGTPRLLLNSQSQYYPNGLLNNYDMVGRCLMLHPLAYTEGVFEENLDSSIGPQGVCLFSQQFYETSRERDFVRGYTMQVLRGSSAIETATKGVLSRRIPLGPKHHQAFLDIYNHNMGIAVIAEDLPDMNNRITLDSNNKDRHGIPGVKIHYQLHENTKAMLKHGIEQSKKVIQAAGGDILYSFYPVKQAGWHIMGTSRMGTSEENSVVNSNGQAHAVKNLFIVDTSIFTTSAAVNPVATAQALTLRICDYIKKMIPVVSSTK
jgi:choline dehydrogenase-like flavoprotein